MKPVARPSAEGGILWRLVVIIAFVGAGAFLWRLYGGRPLPGGLRLPSLPSALGRFWPGRNPPPGKDARAADVWLQEHVRELLVGQGIQESGVLKNFNRERSGGGGRWLEGTLEVAPPASFDPDAFMARLEPVLREKNLSVLDEKRGEESWMLELGEGERVYQRLIFRGAFRPRAKRAAVREAAHV